MFEVPDPIFEIDEEYDEVLEYGMMCDDLIPIHFSMRAVDNEDCIYKARFSMEASFDHNVDISRFKEHVKSCHGVTDDHFEYISVQSEVEFEKEFDMIQGTYKVSIEQGESQN